MMRSVLWPALEGFSLSASLIIAIGAQNAFVLRLGLVRKHVLPVVLFCAGWDAALIAIGAAGFGSLVAAHPMLLRGVGVAGAAFLLWYGLRAFRNALQPATLTPGGVEAPGLRRILGTIAVLTLLNPHVYLDTVVLLGGIAGRYAPPQRVWFVGGAMLASACWFFALGFGARLLAPLFAKPRAWRALDITIGFVMTALAAMLLRDVFAEIG